MIVMERIIHWKLLFDTGPPGVRFAIRIEWLGWTKFYHNI